MPCGDVTRRSIGQLTVDTSVGRLVEGQKVDGFPEVVGLALANFNVARVGVPNFSILTYRCYGNEEKN